MAKKGRRTRQEIERIKELERMTRRERAHKRKMLWKVVDGLDKILIEFIENTGQNMPQHIKEKRETCIEATILLYKQRIEVIEMQIRYLEEIENLKGTFITD